MSGSTVGGVIGGVVGFYFGGPAGAQAGYMIGAGIGGYVDPEQVQGPRMTDAQAQFSNEGVPRAIIYGACVVAGNLIQWGPLVEHAVTERQSKGGPELTTFRYTRTVAIRICEAAPLGGSMKLRRVWMDDKLVADWSEANTIPADTAKFESILTFYSGDEDQLPDPSLEALPVAFGGGVGNVPAYRGSCYAVLTDLDCTDRQGAVPQFRWEVCSDATETTETTTPTIGAQTNTATLSGDNDCGYIDYRPEGIAYLGASAPLNSGATFDVGTMNDALAITSSSTVENVGDSPGDVRLTLRGQSRSWGISADGNFGYCKLISDGSFAADLRPTAGTGAGWWYNEGSHYPEYGGLIWFGQSNVYIGVRRVTSIWNRIFKWPLADAGGDVVAANATSGVVTAGIRFFVHLDRTGTLRAIAQDEAELVTYDDSLTEVSRESLTMSVSSIDAFAVDSGMLILLATQSLRFYDLDTLTLQRTVSLSGSFASTNHQIICTDDSIFVKSGVYVKRIAYTPSCYFAAPPGWYLLPDVTGYVTDGDSIVPLCSTQQTTVTPGMVALDDIVQDMADRAGIDSSQIDVSALSGIEVRGYPVARQTTADAVIRELQKVFFFDFPEWGNSGDTGTKLRAVLRGGASVLTLTDDDLVDNDDDEDIRPQQVEFPRKLSVTVADPEANYEPVTEAAERDTENVKAVGEVQMSTAVILNRAECAQLAEKTQKTLWEEATGRIHREVPDEFSQYTPSDCLDYDGKRYRIERVERRDGSSLWEMVRDRASAATSSASGSEALPPSSPVSSIRGPTLFQVMNLPSLRSADNVPGVYVAAQGLSPGWIGADIYLSVDGGVTEQKVATIVNPATMGELAENIDEFGTSSSGGFSVQLYLGGELESVTQDQLDARQNGFALITTGVAEIGQFQYADETSTQRLYDLSNVERGQLGTTAAAHNSGDRFVLLDGAVLFVPIDAQFASQTLIFRAVSIGTAPAKNTTTSIVFDPPTFIVDGGEVTP